MRSVPCVVPSLSDETVEEARAFGNLRMGIFALDKVQIFLRIKSSDTVKLFFSFKQGAWSSGSVILGGRGLLQRLPCCADGKDAPYLCCGPPNMATPPSSQKGQNKSVPWIALAKCWEQQWMVNSFYFQYSTTFSHF